MLWGQVSSHWNVLKNKLALSTAGNGSDMVAYRSRSVGAKLNDTFSVLDYGGVGGGVANDTVAVTDAIAACAAAGGGTVYGAVHLVDSVIVVPDGVVLDLRGGRLIPSADIDVVHVRPGGMFRNAKMDMRAAVVGFAYTSNAVSLVPVANAQGRQYQRWADNVILRGDLGAGAGTGVFLDASSFYIMEFSFDATVWGFEYGIREVAGAAQWITHILAHVTLTDNIHIHQTNDCSGHTFIGSTERNTYGALRFSGTNIKFHGLIQDGPDITIAADNVRSDGVELRTVAGTDMPNLVDEGVNNRLVGDGWEYFNGRCLHTYRGDRRGSIQAGGRLDFVDQMVVGFDPRWSETIVGTGVVTAGNAQFGAAAGFEQNYAYGLLSCPADNDVAQVDFGGVRAWATGRRPIIHATVADAGANALIDVGLYADANNYILIRYDGVNTGGATGSGTWSIETSAGGVTTTAVIAGSVGPVRINYMSLIITDSQVDIYYGEWIQTNSGSAGQLAKGISILPDTPNASITTNIPVQVAMGPRIRCEADGGAAELKVFDFSILANRKEFR